MNRSRTVDRVLTLARADVRHALRDRLVWGATLLLGLLFLPSAVSGAARDLPLGRQLLLQALDLSTFLLVVVGAVGYNAVVGDRETGALRTTLSLSATRREFVAGKLLARAAAVAVASGVVLVAAGVLTVRAYGVGAVGPYAVLTCWMLLYAVVWTAVTVGCSAAFDSGFRVLAALAVVYAVFSPFVDVWSVLVRPVFALAVTGSTAPPTYDALATAPLWLQVTERLNPVNGFYYALQWSVSAVTSRPAGAGPGLQLFGAAVFLGFGTVGFGWGNRRFERVDLGGGERGSGVVGRVRGLGRFLPTVALDGVPRRSSESRVLTLARADLRRAFGDWVVLGAAALFSLLVVPRLWTTLGPTTVLSASQQVADVPNAFSLPTVGLGIAVGYGAVAGERDAGTLGSLLATGATRRDAVLGKLLTRPVVAVLAVLPAIVAGEVVVVVRLGRAFPAAFLAWATWATLFAAVWTAAVVGLSAAVASRYRALAAAFGTYLLFSQSVGLWGVAVRPLFSLLFTGDPSAYEQYVNAANGVPAWFAYTDHLDPFVALRTIRDGLLVAVGHGTRFTHAPPGVLAFSLAVVVLFPAVVVAVGYPRFARADLG